LDSDNPAELKGVSGGAVGDDQNTGNQIDTKYDWYQNVTHTFVSYKGKKGAPPLDAATLKVAITDDTVTLSNTDGGFVLTSLQLSQSVIPSESTYNCTEHKIELKLKKAVENQNWLSLEQGKGGRLTAAMPSAAAG
jgi:hypothetical protein